MNRLFAKIVDVKPNEIRALWLSFVFFFVVLAGYYVIRPIRDNIGANNYENLWWMFTVVLITMIAANALFSAIVSRMSRRRFIPIAYRFFIINLIIFFFLMRMAPPGKQPWVDGCFFVWVSVFNLFATTVFWSYMTDLFTTEQGKRRLPKNRSAAEFGKASRTSAARPTCSGCFFLFYSTRSHLHGRTFNKPN